MKPELKKFKPSASRKTTQAEASQTGSAGPDFWVARQNDTGGAPGPVGRGREAPEGEVLLSEDSEEMKSELAARRRSGRVGRGRLGAVGVVGVGGGGGGWSWG